MQATLGPAAGHRPLAGMAPLAILAVLLTALPALAQTEAPPLASIRLADALPSTAPEPPPAIVPVVDKEEKPAAVIVPVVDRQEKPVPASVAPDDWTAFPTGDDLIQTSCPSCKQAPGPSLVPGPPPAHLAPAPGHPHNNKLRDTLFWGCMNCGVGNCSPGGKECYPCCATDTAVGRFLCNLYHCICCPDPCYDGRWQPIADAAFFTECARPVSQTRIRWDAGVNMILPDRSEFFWARADGMGQGPKPQAPALVVPRLRYHELSMYTEVASGMVGIIVEFPYRSVDPEFAPHAANFGDMNTAIKTLLFDCELLQVSFMMRTFVPMGSAGKGLGVGHVSLEPSLIFGIKLHPDAYLQGQIAEWIPLGGDPAYAGAILHYHFSLNQVLYRPLPDVPLIGTLEFSGYSFQDGAFTDPVLGPYQPSGRDTYVYLGAGLRLFVCDRIDFGFGVNLALTSEHFADQLYRTEFRWRY